MSVPIVTEPMLALRGLRLRYRPIVTITNRCCNCGSRHSHWWGTFKGFPVCGTCAGVAEPRSA